MTPNCSVRELHRFRFDGWLQVSYFRSLPRLFLMDEFQFLRWLRRTQTIPIGFDPLPSLFFVLKRFHGSHAHVRLVHGHEHDVCRGTSEGFRFGGNVWDWPSPHPVESPQDPFPAKNERTSCSDTNSSFQWAAVGFEPSSSSGSEMTRRTVHFPRMGKVVGRANLPTATNDGTTTAMDGRNRSVGRSTRTASFYKNRKRLRRTLRKTRGGAPHRPRFSAFFKTILIDQQTLMHGCVRPHPPFHPSPTYARTRGSTRPVAQDCILHNFQHLFRHLEDTYGMSSSWYVDGKRLVLISRSGHVSLPICGLDRS